MRSMNATKHTLIEVRQAAVGVRNDFESLYDVGENEKQFRDR